MKKNGSTTYCPRCECDVESTARTVSETYPVKGENITIKAQVRFCSQCGSDVWDDDLDPQNLERAYAVYRQKHGLAPGTPLNKT